MCTMTAEWKYSVPETGHQGLYHLSIAIIYCACLKTKDGMQSFPFNHPGSLYHYRDPVTYAEMRDIIGQHEMEKTAQLLKDCLCYSVQVDGSSDRQ